MHRVKRFSKVNKATQGIGFIVMPLLDNDRKRNKVAHALMKYPKPSLAFIPFTHRFLVAMLIFFFQNNSM